MADVYTTPCVVDIGDFVEQTGEFIGPHTEAILKEITRDSKTYESPFIVVLGTFTEVIGFGIGGQAEGWNPIADRKN